MLGTLARRSLIQPLPNVWLGVINAEIVFVLYPFNPGPYFCFVSGNSLIDLVIIHDITLSTTNAPVGVRRHSDDNLMFGGCSDAK